jgi:hypothetical protein
VAAPLLSPNATTSTYLDGAAILGVLEALDARTIDRAPPWALRCAVEVTVLLVVAPHVSLSPIPEIQNAAIGPYGHALGLLAELLDQGRRDPASASGALRTTQQWAARNPSRLSAVLREVTSDSSYESWLDWLARHQWEDHARRHGGLFEEAFIRPISRALSAPVDELIAIRCDAARDIKRARASSTLRDERDELVRNAFTLSTLLRGRYYETLAPRMGTHVMHHPIRYPLLSRIPPSRRTELELSNTAWFLAVMIVAAAFNVRRRTRADEWVSGIRSTRTQLAQGLLDVRQKESDEVALRVAARCASRVGLTTHPAWVDRVLSASISAGLGGITSVTLSSFEAIGVGVATNAVLESSRAVQRLTARMSSREARLEEIGRIAAGRVNPQWRIEPRGLPGPASGKAGFG